MNPVVGPECIDQFGFLSNLLIRFLVQIDLKLEIVIEILFFQKILSKLKTDRKLFF